MWVGCRSQYVKQELEGAEAVTRKGNQSTIIIKDKTAFQLAISILRSCMDVTKLLKHIELWKAANTIAIVILIVINKS